MSGDNGTLIRHIACTGIESSRFGTTRNVDIMIV